MSRWPAPEQPSSNSTRSWLCRVAGAGLLLAPPLSLVISDVWLGTGAIWHSGAVLICAGLAVVLAVGVYPLLAHADRRAKSLRRIISALPRLAAGEQLELAAELAAEKPKAPDEIDLLRGCLASMAARVRELRDQEARAVASRVRQEERVRAAEASTALAASFVAMAEEERRTLASDLHDEIGQLLLALRMGLIVLGSDRDMRAELRDQVAGMVDAVASTQKTLHATLETLRPVMLDTHGLGGALTAMVEDWRTRSQADTGFALQLEIGDSVDEIPDPLAVTAYRIAQEAVTNAMRHAHAGYVAVRCEVASRPGADGEACTGLLLEVSDDGVGFDPEADTPRYGLLGMRERAAAFGGQVHIDSCFWAGCRVRTWLPVRRD